MSLTWHLDSRGDYEQLVETSKLIGNTHTTERTSWPAGIKTFGNEEKSSIYCLQINPWSNKLRFHQWNFGCLTPSGSRVIISKIFASSRYKNVHLSCKTELFHLCWTLQLCNRVTHQLIEYRVLCIRPHCRCYWLFWYTTAVVWYHFYMHSNICIQSVVKNLFTTSQYEICIKISHLNNFE